MYLTHQNFYSLRDIFWSETG